LDHTTLVEADFNDSSQSKKKQYMAKNLNNLLLRQFKFYIGEGNASVDDFEGMYIVRDIGNIIMTRILKHSLFN